MQLMECWLLVRVVWFLYLACFRGIGKLVLAGSTSEASEDSDPVDDADHVRIFGLGQRDLQRGSRMLTMCDLSPKQIAFCMSTCQKCVSAADLLAAGGEADSYLQPGVSDVHVRAS